MLRRKHELLLPYKIRLFDASDISQNEVQWHIAQMFSYLHLTSEETKKVFDILIRYIETSNSNIVKVNFLQTLTNLALKDESLKIKVIRILEKETVEDNPSIKVRGRRLLSLLTDKHV